MSDVKEIVKTLEDQLSQLSASRYGIRALAIHPSTHFRLAAEKPYWYNSYEQTMHGYAVLRTINVPEGEVRIVPKGSLTYSQVHEKPAIWPDPTIQQPAYGRHFSVKPMDLSEDEAYLVGGPCNGDRIPKYDPYRIRVPVSATYRVAVYERSYRYSQVYEFSCLEENI